MNSLDLLTFALAFIGFGALSASMERHAKQIFGKHPSLHARRLRAALGWTALALALIPAIHAYGLATGIAVWTGFLAVAATVVAFLLTYRPRTLYPTFSTLIAGALLIVLMGWL
jgi:hypothetical protein